MCDPLRAIVTDLEVASHDEEDSEGHLRPVAVGEESRVQPEAECGLGVVVEIRAQQMRIEREQRRENLLIEQRGCLVLDLCEQLLLERRRVVGDGRGRAGRRRLVLRGEILEQLKHHIRVILNARKDALL